jgi:hypothetical protein
VHPLTTGTIVLRLLADGALARRLARASRIYAVGERRVTVRAGRPRAVRIQLRRAARTLLRGRTTVHLVLQARAGGAVVAEQRIALRR